ncbi:MAG: CoA transferase [Microbacterium sp.]|nr:CoA transferase [Microbacterium sp.]
MAISYSSERWFRLDGCAQTGFAPLSSFFRTRDGHVRTHANYPHHRDALLRGLGLPLHTERDDVADALRSRDTDRVVADVTAQGGLCVPVRAEVPARDAALRRAPLVEMSRIAHTPPPPPRVIATEGSHAPLGGIRVLDLTRVIAGPVATRTLAYLGADVLRIDPPHAPELETQHLDTGHGKRSALLDLRSPAGTARFGALVQGADIVVLGYRAAGLERLGVTPELLIARHPGLIVLSLSAWGTPDRRGFDSLVQAESGIALLESTSDEPGALPAQALDHTAGYLLATAAIELVTRRAREGGSWRATTSLRRIAAELLGMPRTEHPTPGVLPASADGHTQTFDVDGRTVTTAGPAFTFPGGQDRFAPPRPWGRDEPTWT